MGHDRTADIGVIGGSGLYRFLGGATEDDVTGIEVDTPYGPPSAPVSVGRVAGRRVAFLPRHGPGHRFPAHRVNYRANLWALARLGVEQVLAPCAVGGLRADLGPGALVVPDQLVDLSRRPQTYFDGPPLETRHVPFADPYCAPGRRAVLAAAAARGWPAADGGTLVVIPGPRFSTRAESRWYAAQGWDVIGMTGQPEAVLAAELGLCYTAVALVTDRDAGVATGDGVTQEEVFALFAEHVDRLREVLGAAVGALPAEPRCAGPADLDRRDRVLALAAGPPAS